MAKSFTYRFGRLVRDKTVPEYKVDDSILAIDYHKLNPLEYKQALVDKLHEEADEIPVQDMADDAVVAELADTYDVLRALMDAYGVSNEMIKVASEKKAQKRGGFAERDYIETITTTLDSPWRTYCLNDPERYPEVKADA